MSNFSDLAPHKFTSKRPGTKQIQLKLDAKASLACSANSISSKLICVNSTCAHFLDALPPPLPPTAPKQARLASNNYYRISTALDLRCLGIAANGASPQRHSWSFWCRSFLVRSGSVSTTTENSAKSTKATAGGRKDTFMTYRKQTLCAQHQRRQHWDHGDVRSIKLLKFAQRSTPHLL